MIHRRRQTQESRPLEVLSRMQLRSKPPFPSQVVANGIPTNFVRNTTPEDTFQIARILGERDYELLFEGPRDQCEHFLRDAIEKEYPGLMKQA
jgi:hypothetical protein